MQESEKISKIEDIKRKLYDRNSGEFVSERHGVLHQIPHDVSSGWTDDENTIMKKNPQSKFFKNFFIGAIIFFFFAIIFAGYMFIRGSTSVSNDNIDISVLGNSFTEGGKELQLQVEIVNKNKSDLELSNIIIEYPRGAGDDPNDVVRLPRESIGTIPAGSRATKIFKVVLYGDQGSVRNVNIKFEYHPAGSNAIFTKDQMYPVTINSSPLSLFVDSPTSTSANQSIAFKVTVNLNTTLPEEGVALSVSYPQGFVFESSDPKPDSSNYIWDLSGLTQSSPATIVITGHLAGQDGEEQAFHVYAGTKKAGQQSIDVVYNSFLQVVNIVKPFLDAKVLVNGNDIENPSIYGGEKVNADIAWVNNLETSVSDAQIVAKITGNVLDKNSVDSGSGFYDSTNNQIIWDKNTVPDLASIDPGQNGKLNFGFSTVSLLGSEFKINNPQVQIEVSIRGRQPEAGIGFVDVNNFSKKIIRVSSDFQIVANAEYVAGSLPPRVGTETKYKISWILSNSTNNVKDAYARATLPIYMKWVGRVSGNAENISYNDVTREVTWRIGNVSANTGFTSGNREADFIVALVPSLSQLDLVPEIIQEVTLTGTDSFTGSQIRNIKSSLDTYLKNDPNFSFGQERVIK